MKKLSVTMNHLSSFEKRALLFASPMLAGSSIFTDMYLEAHGRRVEGRRARARLAHVGLRLFSPAAVCGAALYSSSLGPGDARRARAHVRWRMQVPSGVSSAGVTCSRRGFIFVWDINIWPVLRSFFFAIAAIIESSGEDRLTV